MLNYLDLNTIKNIDTGVLSTINRNIDRIYRLQTLFPNLGKYLNGNNKYNVLQIGINKANIYDREMFLNNNIKFYGLDKEKFTYFNYPSTWEKMFFMDLSKKININLKFDVIIDYGVLGWNGVSDNLSNIEINKYIENIILLLDDEGLYCLKVVKGNKKNNYILNYINKYFQIFPFHNLEEKILEKKEITYHTFIFKLKKNS
jgi:hypothetical protein